MRGHAVHGPAHGVLANAERDVPAGVAPDAADCSQRTRARELGGLEIALPLSAVLVEGFRSADPPIMLGIRLASAFKASPPAARVAMGLSEGFHFGRSAAQLSGSLPEDIFRIPPLPPDKPSCIPRSDCAIPAVPARLCRWLRGSDSTASSGKKTSPSWAIPGPSSWPAVPLRRADCHVRKNYPASSGCHSRCEY